VVLQHTSVKHLAIIRFVPMSLRSILTLLILLMYTVTQAQPGFAFTRMTTDDGAGLASNMVTSIYQDKKGFIWVGTANGLQRFDGSKFITFSLSRQSPDPLPRTTISQILPGDDGTLILAMYANHEFGIFDPSKFTYKKIGIKTKTPLSPRAEFRLWKDHTGNLYCNVLRLGILKYDKNSNQLIESNPFPLPHGWRVNLGGTYDDETKKQVYIGCDSGLAIYDRASKQTWTRYNNPRNIGILNTTSRYDRITEVFIDKQRRTWLFSWPSWGNGGQLKSCFGANGEELQDTVGLNPPSTGYSEYSQFTQTAAGDLWVYGLRALFNYDRTTKRFYYTRTSLPGEGIGIQYEYIYQVLEDKDGGMWFATDRGLYFTSVGDGTFSVINFVFNSKHETISITDILELPGGDIWLTSWGSGVITIDKSLSKKENAVYATPYPKGWTEGMKGFLKLTWSMCRQSSTGEVWIGCNGGYIIKHDPVKKTSQYLKPDETNNSTVRYITEDSHGNIWLGTQGGRLIKYSNNQFTVVKDLETIIYKIFIDKQGMIWLATHEKGLYGIDGNNGNTLQHYTADNGASSLFANTGADIEQLNDSIIAFGANALNLINKKTGKVRWLTLEDGLPSNSVMRLRMDNQGYLWMITSNGLCRYNPNNNRITSYTKKDGIVLAEQTTNADFFTSNNYLLFGGSNALLMFNPATYTSTKRPPDVVVTDFKIFNTFYPVDSLLRAPEIKLNYDQNSISIYFSSLSFVQRDKLTYYYKMEGIDKDWIIADRSYSINYSLLPPGNYTFKIYCENLEGLRSNKITELQFVIKPPFYRTWWFYSSLLFVGALLAYAMHDLRVNRLLAVEKLRNRVARDLHDDMGSTLSTINILSSMAKTKMNVDAVKTGEYLTKISDNSQRMMEAMDDIVWSIKPSNDSMQKITARMREFAINVLEAKDINMQFSVEEQVYDVKLNMEARRDFFLVFKEAVNNAAKYSKATNVYIKISLKHRQITLEVKDDGVGFDVNAADEGNGLGNMKKRADAMNGQVKLQSKPGEGTTMTLTIPTSLNPIL
jgi:signal transduction histidine kinase/ligand-binding sensor domain-containing protein